MDLNASVAEKRIERNSVPQLPSLLSQVCHAHHVEAEDIGLPCRMDFIVEIRNEFYYRALAETDKSLVGVARFLGTHHTTVIHGAVSHAVANQLPFARRGSPSRVKRILALKRYRRLSS